MPLSLVSVCGEGVRGGEKERGKGAEKGRERGRGREGEEGALKGGAGEAKRGVGGGGIERSCGGGGGVRKGRCCRLGRANVTASSPQKSSM
jgi:hypothetical protein